MDLPQKTDVEGISYITSPAFFDSTVRTMEMPFSEHEDWFNAIIANDTDAMVAIFDAANSDYEKKLLLNGQFIYDENHMFTNSNYKLPQLRCSLPLSLAAIFRAKEALDFLLEEGCDVTGSDATHQNMLHSIVCVASLNPASEAEFADLYVNTILRKLEGNIPAINKLLMQENDHGLRPMEQASSLGVFELTRCFLNTRGVYLRRVEDAGIYYTNYIDITDYETCDRTLSRADRAPLLGLLYLDRSRLKLQSTINLFGDGFMASYLEKKKASVMPFLVLWSLMRFTMVIVYFIYDSDHSFEYNKVNDTRNMYPNHSDVCHACNCKEYVYKDIHPTFLYILAVYILVHSSLCIAFDLVDFFSNVCNHQKDVIYRSNLQCKKKLVLTVVLFRFSQFVFSLSVFLGTLIPLIMHEPVYKLDGRQGIVADICHLFICTMAVSSIMHFLQLLPNMGYYITAMSYMMLDLFNFMLLFAVGSLPYIYVLHTILNSKDEGCRDEVSTLGKTIYSTFLMSLNMVSFKQSDAIDFSAYMMIHIVFTFMVPILMLNFLIAVFSNTVSEVTESKDILISIQWLYIVNNAERVARMLCPSLYTRMHRRQFYHDSNGRIYFVYFVYKFANEDFETRDYLSLF